MLPVVGLHGSHQRVELTMDGLVVRNIDLCGSSPDNHDAGAVVLGFEIADVLTNLLHHIPAGSAVLDIIAVETLGVVLVKSSLHRLDQLQLITHRIDVFLLEYLSIDSCLIGILWIDIPTAEDDVIEFGQRDDVTIMEVFLLLATPHTNLVVLCH